MVDTTRTIMTASDVLNRLTAHKRSQGDLLRYVRQQNEALAGRIYDCGSWLRIREWINSGESRLRNANFCKSFLLCRSCAARRAGRMVEAYAAKVGFVSECNPELIPAMVTLTVKNGDDLAERLLHLKTAWRAMLARARKAKSNSKKNLPIQWNKVVGCLRAIEITHSKHGWHPHIHVFALLSSYIDQKELSAQWLELTGDSFVVGVTECKNGIVPGLIECLKYASKLSELEPHQAYHVYETAKGSRFTDPQGLLRGVSEPDIDFDDDTGCDGPYRDFIARWLAGEQRYAIKPVEEIFIIERPHRPEAQPPIEPIFEKQDVGDLDPQREDL